MSLGRSLDGSLNIGEEVRFKQKHKKLMLNLAKQSRLTYDEIEHMAVLYYKLQLCGEGKDVPVSRTLIMDFLHHGLDMTNFYIHNYMLGVLDKTLSPYMTLENWIKAMALFLKGTFEDKIKFCYSVYLTTGITDKLIRNSLIFLMKRSLFKDQGEPDDEGVKDFVDMIIKRMDRDRDGKISFDDYEQTVRENSGFLESFGQLLPDPLAIFALKKTFMPNLKNFYDLNNN